MPASHCESCNKGMAFCRCVGGPNTTAWSANYRATRANVPRMEDVTLTGFDGTFAIFCAELVKDPGSAAKLAADPGLRSQREICAMFYRAAFVQGAKYMSEAPKHLLSLMRTASSDAINAEVARLETEIADKV